MIKTFISKVQVKLFFSVFKLFSCFEIDLIKNGIIARGLINDESIRNACKVALSFGGSTNMILHMCALSHEIGEKLTHNDFETLNRSVPLLAKFKPASNYNITDFHK
ncbi:unnamed protein product, partial [marine sediment metagenome]